MFLLTSANLLFPRAPPVSGFGTMKEVFDTATLVLILIYASEY